MGQRLPEVRVLATGGTIANPPDVDGYIDGDELVRGIPALSDAADLTVEDVSSIGSSEMTPEVWYDLHERIEAIAAEDDVDGVVIPHGSNTMEETAYFLNLTLETDVPVVLTAALRNRDTIGNDGDRNLLDAIRVAGHPDAAGRGVLVVVNDHVHHSRDVTKTVSGRPDSWSSGDFGALGLVDKRGEVRFYRRVDRCHAPDTDLSLESVEPDDFFDVPIVYSVVGSDGSSIRRELEADPAGLVLAALPTGSPVNPRDRSTQAEALDEAADRDIPVVVSQRGHEGWVDSGLIDRDDRIWADTLSPQKARILLTLGLGSGADTDSLQELFLSH